MSEEEFLEESKFLNMDEKGVRMNLKYLKENLSRMKGMKDNCPDKMAVKEQIEFYNKILKQKQW